MKIMWHSTLIHAERECEIQGCIAWNILYKYVKSLFHEILCIKI